MNKEDNNKNVQRLEDEQLESASGGADLWATNLIRPELAKSYQFSKLNLSSIQSYVFAARRC